MSGLAIRSQTNGQAAESQARFLKMLPAIEAFAVRSFAGRPRHEREELVAEAVAAAFVMFVALVRRGKAELAFATPLARYGCRHVRQGRRVGTRLNVKDMSSPYCQKRKNMRVESLDRFHQRDGVWREAVVEDHRTPVAEQAAFRCDYPAWLDSLSRRKRRIAKTLSTGESTSRVARMFRVSASRVSQIRHELNEAWLKFHGEFPIAASPAAATA